MGVFMLFEINHTNIACGQRILLPDFSLRVRKTDKILLLGKNGSGKTTLIKYICRQFKDTCRISYLQQNDMLPPYLSVWQNLQLAGGAEKADALLQHAGLCAYKNFYPYQLSGGLHRQLLILRALLFPFDLLILDEPFVHLDEAAIPLLCEIIKRETANRALLLSTHQNIEQLNFHLKKVIVCPNAEKIVS